MLDCNDYDTRDSVARDAEVAFNDLGARFLTVHATPSMLEAAMRAKPPGDYCKVLAVGPLTDHTDGRIDEYELAAARADGVICPVRMVGYVRSAFGTPPITVCPGIRLRGTMDSNPFDADNHVNPATPAEAKAAGADYIVVGRPIYEADDPVAAARAIMAEL
jgi:orotidine-5'-phosphate decarboxylase